MIKSAKFVKSCPTIEHISDIPELPQIAFVGRSNVGKSSLLNMLVNQKKLAVTSQTPGRTRLINFFEVKFSREKGVDEDIHFVDLPGYGFAAASKSMKYGWGENITEYLVKSQQLELVFILLDIRHLPSELDLAMLHFLQSHGIPFSILATKVDKISRSESLNLRRKLANSIGVGERDIIMTSSKGTQGRVEVFARIQIAINTEAAE
ncbi:MAG: ribosome biogenesis GTP-binding protein YihA/YsxC [Firmicutes bacterium]|nr:ribosome biogenesis GTP-binding protein YihA/YsxC [Bacillota bacterium]